MQFDVNNSLLEFLFHFFTNKNKLFFLQNFTLLFIYIPIFKDNNNFSFQLNFNY